VTAGFKQAGPGRAREAPLLDVDGRCCEPFGRRSPVSSSLQTAAGPADGPARVFARYHQGVGADLSGRVVLITGGGIGIGRELALAFARAGCSLGLTYYEHRAETEEVAQLCRTLGAPDVLTSPLQLADDDSVRELVEAVVGHYGGVDILVHNAGIVDWRRFLDQDFWSIENQLAVNLGGVMKLTWAILPMVRDTFVFIGSTATLHDSHTPPTYVATKWGLRGFMKAMARERPAKRFVCVHPTVTATRLNEMAGMPPQRVAEIVVRVAAHEIEVPSGGDVDMRDFMEA
jgi:NAD(P)-dependent dehydrogenase (short-subunit alcohol dehydrogenase family)